MTRLAAAVPLSAVAGNLVSYGLLLAAARVLDHGSYGSFLALMTLVAVGAIPSLALQAVAARRVAAGEGTAGLWPVTVGLAVATGGGVAALTPVLDAFLRIDSAGATLWLAASLVPLTLSGPLLGLAQGAERLVLFAGCSLAQALGRFGGALVPLSLGHGEVPAMAGATVGSVLATIGCALALRGAGQRSTGDPSAHSSVRSVAGETAHALHGYAAVLLLTGFDLLLTRHVVSAEQASEYAAGSVVTKAVVWLPQWIGLVVFARMATPGRRRAVVRRAAAVTAGIGLLASLGAAVAGGVVSSVVGGDFAVVRSSAWTFALLGTGLAVIQFTVMAGLAAREPRRLLVPWLAIAGEAVVIPLLGPSARASTVVAAVAAVVGVAAVIAVLLAVEWRPRRPAAAALADVAAVSR